MPITIIEITERVKEIGWKYELSEDQRAVILHFGTEHHVAPDGEKHVFLIITVEVDGEFVEVTAPETYNLNECKYKGATLVALAELAFRTRGLQCQYNSENGEVSYAVDAWLLDNTLTTRQLDMMIRTVVDLMEEHESVIRNAMETGKVDFELAIKREQRVPEEGQTAPLPPEIAELMVRAGGLDGLRQALELAERQKIPA